MDASFNKGATMIALKAIPALSGRSFAPGDVVPWRKLAIAERRVAQMVGAKMIGELSQETFDFAMKRRTPEHGPHVQGFTPAGLEALGVKAGTVPKAKTEKAPKQEAEVAYTESKVHRGYALRGKSQGIATGWDVFNAEQERLNPGGMLRGMKKVDSFIDTLEAEAARLAQKEGPASETAPEDAAKVEGAGGVDGLGAEGYGEGEHEHEEA